MQEDRREDCDAEETGDPGQAGTDVAEVGAVDDVVARDAVTAILRKQVIKPSPWWQVSPGWWLMRISPRAYTWVSGRTFKSLFG